MCSALKLEVVDLKRVSIGVPRNVKGGDVLELGDLSKEGWRELSQAEVLGLREMVVLSG